MKTLEDWAREIIAVAVQGGLVSSSKDPMSMSSGDVVGVANLLSKFAKEVKGEDLSSKKAPSAKPSEPEPFFSVIATTDLGGGNIISTLEFSQNWTFRESVESIPGIKAGMDVKALSLAIIAGGYAMTQLQIDKMIEKTNCGENSFFFIKTGDPKNPVSVGLVFRGGRDWRADVCSLGLGFRWGAGRRLLLRNLSGTLNLGP